MYHFTSPSFLYIETVQRMIFPEAKKKNKQTKKQQVISNRRDIIQSGKYNK